MQLVVVLSHENNFLSFKQNGYLEYFQYFCDENTPTIVGIKLMILMVMKIRSIIVMEFLAHACINVFCLITSIN